jgi:hypothetical protein
VAHITTAIGIRLSAAQMSIIWPGLDLICKSCISRQRKGGIRYEYPFRTYPPPGGFNPGIFDQSIMEEILALWKKLRPKAKTGGRVQMNAIELRASIFAIRANLGFVRKALHEQRRLSQGAKTRFLLDTESYAKLKAKSELVILSLERHRKRANRLLKKSIDQNGYQALINAWTAHLRWMRLHIAYFKRWPPIIQGRKIQQQNTLDRLMHMAVYGIRDEGYEQPEGKELRRIMRLYVRSARRGREGMFTIPYLMKPDSNVYMNIHLAQFVIRRLTLKELPQS